MHSSLKPGIITVITSLLIVFFYFTSFSQTNRFSISINSLTTNFNYGKANGELQPYKKNFKGLQAGVSYQAGITPSFSLVPELYFAMKGGILKDKNPVTSNKSTLRLYTIEMPVLARVHCKKLYLNAGPYIAYATGGRIKIDGADIIPGTSTSISFEKSNGNFKRWDAGIQAGAGYNFDMKKSVLTLDVRYSYGFVNMSNDIERYNRMLIISLVLSKRSPKM